MFASQSAGPQPGMSHFGSVGAANSSSMSGAPLLAADDAAAPSSMDCGVSQLCQDSSAKAKAQEDQWVYVGEGKGNFEQVAQMQPFIGGSWARQELKPGGGGCIIFGWIASLLLVAAFAFAVIYSFTQNSGDQQVGRDVRPEVYDCNEGLTGGSISDMTKAMLATRFHQADISGDEKLSTPEIADASRSIYPRCFLAPMDQDKDGLMDSSEVASTYPKAQESLLFALADADCDGRLTADELEALQDTKTFMPSKLKTYLNQSDVNVDSVLSKDEFVAAVKKFEKTTENSALSGYSTWKPAKKNWCCKYNGLGCEEQATSAPYDCTSNDWTWKKAWSPAKKAYCCKNSQVGCEKSPTYDCRSQYDDGPQDWSSEKKQFCCSQYSRGCETPSKPYDCQAGLTNWNSGWSLPKKAWCCKNEKLGCDGEHDCFKGYVTWRTIWSDEKKQFCCRTHGRGCTDATPPSPSGVIYDCQKDWDHWEEAWTAEKKQFCCSQYERGCNAEKHASELFDCKANNWKQGWSNPKQRYCCQHHDIGCGASSEPFDCKAGVNNGWTNPKKMYCCQHHSVGCAPAAAAAAVASGTEPFDCQAGAWNWKAGWSPKKKAWCCSHKEVGCATLPSHDCDAGWYDWQAVWSAEKKTWCCLKEHRGCVTGGAAVNVTGGAAVKL